jgi:hypothetical protein
VCPGTRRESGHIAKLLGLAGAGVPLAERLESLERVGWDDTSGAPSLRWLDESDAAEELAIRSILVGAPRSGWISRARAQPRYESRVDSLPPTVTSPATR